MSHLFICEMPVRDCGFCVFGENHVCRASIAISFIGAVKVDSERRFGVDSVRSHFYTWIIGTPMNNSATCCPPIVSHECNCFRLIIESSSFMSCCFDPRFICIIKGPNHSRTARWIRNKLSSRTDIPALPWIICSDDLPVAGRGRIVVVHG